MSQYSNLVLDRYCSIKIVKLIPRPLFFFRVCDHWDQTRNLRPKCTGEAVALPATATADETQLGIGVHIPAMSRDVLLQRWCGKTQGR